MSEKLITIVTFINPMDAELARIRLARDGIESFLMEKDLIHLTLDWGVRLQVKESDAGRAIQILKNAPYEDFSNEIPKDLCDEESKNDEIISEDSPEETF